MQTKSYKGSDEIRLFPALERSFIQPKSVPIIGTFLTSDIETFNNPKTQKILQGNNVISGYHDAQVSPIIFAFRPLEANENIPGHKGTMQVWRNNSLIVRSINVPTMQPQHLVFITSRKNDMADNVKDRRIDENLSRFVKAALLSRFISNESLKEAALQPLPHAEDSSVKGNLDRMKQFWKHLVNKGSDLPERNVRPVIFDSN